MTFIKDTKTVLAGFNLVLKSTATAPVIRPTPLISWLSPIQPLPVLIPLRITDGVTRIIPVLPDLFLYPNLMQSICQRIGQDSLVEWEQKPYELTGVEVDFNELHIIQVSISAIKPLPATLGRAIHALFFHWLAVANPTLAEHLHQQNIMPITLAMQYCSSQKMQLRITLLTREILAPLLWGLSGNLGGEIVLADIPCRLGKWIDIVQASSFEKLALQPTQNVIELQFLSPTSFKQNQNIQPFPLPELVFGNLLRRWNRFAPEALQFSEVEWKGLVSAYELKTYALKMEGGAEIGSEGWVKYRFSDPEQARIATVLANFAVFAGVGRKTAMGMGQTALKINKIS
jgi:CRISPR-associated endoribonuclease Cas6